MDKFLHISPADNVDVAIEPIDAGALITVNESTIRLLNAIETGHKFELRNLQQSEDVVKYGYPIGHALESIKAGEHVHTHNLKTNLHDNLEYSYNPVNPVLNIPKTDRTFKGYLRSNGEAGIRNELWIVPTVGCVNGQAQAIINRVKSELDVSHIDDIRVYTHNYGCSQLGDDHENTKNALSALARHPNAGGVLVMSLGC